MKAIEHQIKNELNATYVNVKFSTVAIGTAPGYRWTATTTTGEVWQDYQFGKIYNIHVIDLIMPR